MGRGGKLIMTKDVLVSINGLQIARQSEEAEPVEVITAGDYYKKNNKNNTWNRIASDEYVEFSCSRKSKRRRY